MNADEIVKALRTNDLCPQVIVGGKEVDANRAAADLIESLQAQLAKSQRREKAAVEVIRVARNLLSFAIKGQWSFAKEAYKILKEFSGPQEAGEGERNE